MYSISMSIIHSVGSLFSFLPKSCWFSSCCCWIKCWHD